MSMSQSTEESVETSSELEEKKEKEGKSDKFKKTPPRTEPQSLEEALTLQKAQAGAGKEIMEDKINDPRYPKEEWEKKQHIHDNPDKTKINVHYWENRITGHREGFKFKNK